MNLYLLYGASDVLYAYGVLSYQAHVLLVPRILKITQLLLQLRNQLFGNLEDLELVFVLGQSGQSFTQLPILSSYEFFFFGRVPHDLFKQQVDCLLLVALVLAQHVEKASNAVWSVDTYVMAAALLHQVVQFPLSLLALLDLGGVWQVVG